MPEVNPFKPLDDSERKTLSKLTKPDVTVEILIPSDISADDYWETLGTYCHALGKSMAQTEFIMPVLGKLLLVAKDHPEIYKDKGLKTYEDFLGSIKEKFGVERSTCFEARKLAERWGDGELKDFAAIGRVKFQLINKLVPKGDEGKPNVKKLLEAAKGMSVEEFKDHLSKKGLMTRSESTGASINIQTSKRVYKDWQKFITTPEVVAKVGSEQPDKILDAMMQECLGEWINQGAEILKTQAEEEQAASAGKD